MVGVPHTSGLRVGVLVFVYAEGIEAPLRARGSALSHVQLLPAFAAVGNGARTECIRQCAGEDAGALPIPAGRV